MHNDVILALLHCIAVKQTRAVFAASMILFVNVYDRLRRDAGLVVQALITEPGTEGVLVCTFSLPMTIFQV